MRTRRGEEKGLRTNNSSDAERLLIGHVLITSLFLATLCLLVVFAIEHFQWKSIKNGLYPRKNITSRNVLKTHHRRTSAAAHHLGSKAAKTDASTDSVCLMASCSAKVSLQKADIVPECSPQLTAGRLIEKKRHVWEGKITYPNLRQVNGAIFGIKLDASTSETTASHFFHIWKAFWANAIISGDQIIA